MAITDIEIEDTLRVGAPSIKYEDKDTTPANPMLIAGPDRYQRILEDLINELEGELGRELTDLEYEEVGKEAYDRFHSGDYAEGGQVDYSKDPNYKGWKKTYEINPDAAEQNENHAKYLSYYNSSKNQKAEGGIMNLKMGGMPAEMDLRGGGFVPIGAKEKADDVPARLSKNEFVMTADAVRAAGGGSVNKGAKRMYDLMNKLEARV